MTIHNTLSHEQSRAAIASMISQHLSEYPHDTGYFIHAVTHGLNEFANKQKDNAYVFLNYLTDVMVKNPDIRDGDLYDVGRIAADIIPRWKGAGIYKELVDKFGEKAKVYEEELKKENEKKEAQKKMSYGEKNKVAEQFGT